MIIYIVPIYDNLPLLGLEDDIDADIEFFGFSPKEYSSRKHKLVQQSAYQIYEI